ncbi:hypothetical protein M758_10G104300 [Ceratodon purpureus]|nr:hypothetical protein M758_10G104300 [Ceratodon purpureus]
MVEWEELEEEEEVVDAVVCGFRGVTCDGGRCVVVPGYGVECKQPAMEPSRRTMSGGYANNPPPGMGHIRGGGTPQQEWALNNQINRGEEWARGSPRSGPQNNVENWGVGAVGEGRPSSYSSYSWSMANERGDIGLSSSPHVNGNLDNSDSIRGVDANSFSTSFPALFDKLRLSESESRVVQQLEQSAAVQLITDLDPDETYGSLEELEFHTIGNLLPDDEEDLLAGVADDYDLPPSRRDEVTTEEQDEFDLFSSGGGMELEGDSQDALGVYMSKYRAENGLTGGAPGQQSGAAGSVAGEHPYGEHPSRTLFVRNINSNVEDTELRALFEQYGAIRTLYTACKHRGFVMISYYDIRAARSAMRALQNKPLRRRKLDIHFSIPKDNPSDKDVNQGTLVVFNLDASVSNDDLRHIFGVYGEVKEIRETPHKRHHKFIEFYDVRAAEAALRSLNRSDIAGKRIKLEPSRPGGARRSSLLQQLNQDSGDDDLRPRQQSHSPLNSSPPGHPSTWNAGAENGSLRQIHHSLPHGNFQLPSKPLNGASLPPHISQPIRVGTIGSHVAQSNQMEAGHSLGHMGLSSHRLPPHPHSLPEFGHGLINPGHLTSPGSGTSVSNAAVMRAREARETRDSMEGGSRLQRTTSGTGSFSDTSALEHASGGDLLFSNSNGSSSLSGHQFNLWGTPTSSFSHMPHSSPPVLWSNSSSVGPSFNAIGQAQLQSHAFSASHSNLLPMSRHHVGSAPSGEPSLLERRHSYIGGESLVEASSLLRSASGTGLGGSAAHAINIGGNHGLMNLSGSLGGNSGLEHASSSSNLGMMSPQHRARFLQNGGLLASNSIDSLTDRGRSRRSESISAQADNKKQFQLDLDRIMRGEDPRTTLMIKNIPNKYTSKMLLAAIDENHRGTYDFIYLPIDFKNKCNVGYAFINMTAPARIVPFYKAFNGKKWEKFNSEKVASLAYARIQGKAALVAHFQNSSLMNEDKRCRPILFHSEGPHVGDQVD